MKPPKKSLAELIYCVTPTQVAIWKTGMQLGALVMILIFALVITY